jgi:hypothetical protein
VIGATRTSLIGVVAVLVLLHAAITVGPLTSRRPVCASGHGVYAGAAAPDEVAAFEEWTGASVGCVEDFLSSSSWADISEPTWWISRWARAKEWHPLVLSVPLLPDVGADLRSGAEGAYDEHFAKLAELLVRNNFSDATIRLGWEFNGGEFPWAVLPGGGPDGTRTADNFIAYWRRVVMTMRSTSGAHFTFDWSVNNGKNIVDAETAYPGDEFVDIVGIDAYDQVWGPDSGQVEDPVQRWLAISNGKHNLDWWAEFARSHGKSVSVAEWGLIGGGHGGGDNPYYVEHILSWAKENRAAYEIYLNAARSLLLPSSYPEAAEAYTKNISRT